MELPSRSSKAFGADTTTAAHSLSSATRLGLPPRGQRSTIDTWVCGLRMVVSGSLRSAWSPSRFRSDLATISLITAIARETLRGSGNAAQLAHAAERAQRDRSFALDAVARAR